METDGTATLRYLPGGVVCDVALPPASMAPFDPAVVAPEAITFSNVQAEPKRSGNDIRVLVVEDSFMIISALELAFESFGWTMVGPATRISKALALLKTESFDAVLLDVNLDGEMSWDIAVALQTRGTPFVLSTGYEVGPLLPEFLRGTKSIRKPFKIDELQKSISDILRLAGGNLRD